ncbi:MAG: hypothetical protein M1820_005500 [Bogoriella megaspora]|nr:MAG: hypothetical protein M1820_005500 [Bogoriella megaspora]
MKVSNLYIYPVKSLRGIALSQSEFTRLGFPFDRRFMLYKVNRDDAGIKYVKMQVSQFPEMCLFHTDIEHPDENDPWGKLFVTYSGIKPNSGRETIEVPLIPETGRLEVLKDMDLHHSPTNVHNMGEHYNKWFSKCFDFEVLFVYLGANRRKVLFPEANNTQENKSWMSTITSYLPSFGYDKIEKNLTFSDVAPYLIVSKTSLRDVSGRLPDGEDMDITKFRPNVIVEGADEEWEEDYWSEITIGDVKLHLIHNCARCSSINIDYDTGKPGTGESGTILKKLMKDRRVDPGTKWSPIFGRYGFLDPASEGQIVTVGDEATITNRNEERSIFGELPDSNIIEITNRELSLARYIDYLSYQIGDASSGTQNEHSMQLQ